MYQGICKIIHEYYSWKMTYCTIYTNVGVLIIFLTLEASIETEILLYFTLIRFYFGANSDLMFW